MKKILISVLSIFTILFGTVSANAFAEQKPEGAKRIVVKLKNEQANKSFKFTSFQVQNQKENIKILEVPKADAKGVLEKLKQDPNVDFVEEEINYQFFAAPNDKYFQQYQLKDFNLIKAPQAWDLSQPKKTPIVAVVDSGIDSANPDLKNQIYRPYNAMVPGTQPYDDVSHGTHVAGIVGAQTNNGIGVASVSKGALIMPVKVGDKYGISSIDIANGIYYAVDNGASIINMSLGGYQRSEYVVNAINYAYSKGVLVIAAAGNDGISDPSYPASLSNVMSVAAVDSTNNSLADFSNYGSTVDIAAPGVDILSTVPTYMDSIGYNFKSGTSMASPMVASLAALLKNQEPNLTHNQIRWIMEETSDNYYGSEYNNNGRINAYGSLSLYRDYSRIYGNTSVETSTRIAELGWSEGPESRKLAPQDPALNPGKLTQEGTFAILASNLSFPDSLSAGALANMVDAPILLTYPGWLSQSTVDTLRDLNVKNVLVLGGPTAVSDNVLNGLKNNGFTVNRLQGENRFSTAVEVNDYVAKKGGEVIVANGFDFPDALSVSAFSAEHQIPIVFVDKNSIPQETAAFLKKYQPSKTIIIGGPNAVSESVKGQLPNPVRIAGNDRFETNIKVINYFMGDEEVEGFLFATGMNFPDALAGGPFSAKVQYPLVLLNSNYMPGETYKYLQKRVANNPYYYDMATLGGSAALAPYAVWSIDRLFYDDFYQSAYSSTQYQSLKKEMNTKFIKK